MQMQKFKRNELPFSGRIVELLCNNQEFLQPLIGHSFSVAHFKDQIIQKQNFSQSSRITLHDALYQQYNHAKLEVPSQLNFLLKDNCFTVCTGHQLNLFTGPLYVIYKIAHTIKLAQELQEKYPKNRIIPVFWLASEDHDLEEINHYFVGEKKIEWLTNQSGAVGNMHLENWEIWHEQLTQVFPNHTDKINNLLNIYQGENLSIATRRLIAHLFQDTDLLIVDGNDTTLKTLFIPTFRKELEEQFSFKAVQETGSILKEKNLKAQAHSREINLFHLSEGGRVRIERLGEHYNIGESTFTKTELLNLVQLHPEQFSPNVILRPLYQETVLPNLCYVGGAGELAYWLQLKPVFDAVQVPYPILKLRVSIQIMSQKQVKKVAQFGLTFPEISAKKEVVLKQMLSKLSKRKEAGNEISTLMSRLEEILIKQAADVDVTMLSSAKAERVRIEKMVESFMKKLQKNEKIIHADVLGRLSKLHGELFPNDGLQERNENFISYFTESQGHLIDEIINQIQAFEDDFLVVISD